MINLRGLFLYGCEMQRTENFFPERLETVCIFDGRTNKAMHLQNLKSLQTLEISTEGGVAMLPNAISSLSSLRELHIMGGFDIRDHARFINYFSEATSDWDEFSYTFISWVPMLDEISELTHLTSSKIFIENSEPFRLPYTFNNLSKYHLCVGPPMNSSLEPRLLHVSSTDHSTCLVIM